MSDHNKKNYQNNVIAEMAGVYKKYGNTVALDGGNDKINMRFSYTNSQINSIIPNSKPEILVVELDLQKKDPPTIEAILVKGQALLIDVEEDEVSFSNMWKLSFREFTLKTLKETLSREWHVPEKQIELRPESSNTIKYALPKGKTIGNPGPA